MQVSRGQLVAVIGPVGAGKSSLLSAILGQMQRCDGNISVNVRRSGLRCYVYGSQCATNLTSHVFWKLKSILIIS